MIAHLEPAHLLKHVALLEMANLDAVHILLPLVAMIIKVVVQMDTLVTSARVNVFEVLNLFHLLE